ncbi:DSBA-like thioredoxin domain-containing protein [Xylaria sp. FL0043]|nr:DSBA-like thioredoxin domain-containing protein [Xylaria sp. FL0043]
MTVIEIDVVSDFVCAWCYIGKRKLESAIALYQKVYPGGKHDIFKINWRPYYLGYNKSGCSVEKSELAKIKLADWSEEKKAAAMKRVEQAGLYLSRGKSPELTNALVEKIFEAYHGLEKDISSLDLLRDIALEAGFEKCEVDEWLSSKAAAESVDEEAKVFREKVTDSGVPCYIIQDLYRLDGAQDADDFMEVFVKFKEDQHPSS